MNGFDAERFDRLVAQHASPEAQTPFDASQDGALDSLLLHSFLLYDSNAADADRALKKLLGAFVDLNELRVARVDEIAAAIGVRYCKSEERAGALKRTLNDLFAREHAVTLASAAEKNKRDAKQYLASLDACPPFVSSRVLLLGFGGHATPLDSLLLTRLTACAVFEDGVEFDRAASILERHVKAADALMTHLALERLRETDAPAPARRPRSGSPAARQS